MRQIIILVEEHGFSYADINSMSTYELEVNIALILEYLENKKKKR